MKAITSIVSAAMILAGSQAMAVPFNSDGSWLSVEGTPSGTTSFIDGDANGSDERVEYGEPFPSGSGGPKSAYEFIGVTGGDAPLDGTPFELGDFKHDNFVIFGPSITGATLQVDLDFTADGVSSSFTYFFEHNETPNDASPCAIPGTAIPCPDGVSIPDAASVETVMLAGDEYRLVVDGFIDDTGAVVDQFITLEEAENIATLVAHLELVPPVATPAPGALLLVGTLLLGAGMRRVRG